ncbi:MAG: hypothetical protein M1308_23685, partial [Actinobacteria bacterium]|nr:hypothetical protein [Actinomycetota bacterium]
LPVDAVRKMDVDFIIAVALNNIDRKEPPTAKTSIINIIDLTLAMMEREIETGYFSRADVIIAPKTGDFGIFEFGKASEIINTGRISALEKIGEIKKKVS